MGGLVLSFDFSLVRGLGEFLVTVGKDGLFFAEKFGDSGQCALKVVREKEIEKGILVVRLILFVHGWCCFV